MAGILVVRGACCGAARLKLCFGRPTVMWRDLRLLRCGNVCCVWRGCVATGLAAAVRQDLLARLAVVQKGWCEMAGRAAVMWRSLLCGGGSYCGAAYLAVVWRNLR